MKTRKLGTMDVSELGSGCMSLSYNYGGPVPAEQGIRVLRTAYDKGVTFFDTAEVYGPYTNETLVGEALEPFRKTVRIATKFGFDIEGDGAPFSEPRQIRKVAEASLKRLRTDYIDLFYQHRVDPKVAIEDVAGAVKDLIAEGKVLHFGLSEAAPDTIRRAHSVQPVTAVQTEYSIMERSPETNGVLATCEELGIGYVPWGPVGMGYLPGLLTSSTQFDTAKNDMRAEFDRFTEEALAANRSFVELLKGVGAEKGATPAQIALAWLLAQKPWIVPIPGTGNLHHLAENIAATEVELTADDLAKLRASAEKLKVHGGRMNAMQMGVVETA